MEGLTMKYVRSAGDRTITWIEKFCLFPDGPDRGKRVALTYEERASVRAIYDAHVAAPISGSLAGFIVLFHICGPAGRDKQPLPPVEVDSWTVWRAASPELQTFLKRDGLRIVCPDLGTAFPIAA
jgi:hypothetical protein